MRMHLFLDQNSCAPNSGRTGHSRRSSGSPDASYLSPEVDVKIDTSIQLEGALAWCIIGSLFFYLLFRPTALAKSIRCSNDRITVRTLLAQVYKVHRRGEGVSAAGGVLRERPELNNQPSYPPLCARLYPR